MSEPTARRFLALVDKETDGLMPPTIDVPPSGGMSIADVTGILHLFEQMLLSMEARIVRKFEESAKLSDSQWAKHDAEADRTLKRMDDRFVKIEQQLLTVDTALESHLVREREEDIIMDARVKPVKNAFTWVAIHWRDIVLLLVALLGFAALTADWLSRAIRLPV